MRNPIGSLLRYLLALVFFAIFGPGFMALSWNRLKIECTRPSGSVDCRLADAYAFGLVVFDSHAEDVRGIEIHTNDSSPTDAILTSRVRLVGSRGAIPVGRLSTNFGDGQKRNLLKAVERFLSSSENDLSHSELTIAMPFLLFSLPFTVLFLLGLLTPFRLLLSLGKTSEEKTARRVEKLEVLVKGAETPATPLALPLVFQEGFPPLQKAGRWITVAVIFVMSVQIGFYFLGWLSGWQEIFVTGIFLPMALSLTRARRVEIDREWVTVTYDGWLAPRPKTLPLSDFEAISVETEPESEPARYQAELVHRRSKKKNLKLWRPAIPNEKKARELAAAYETLLGLDHRTSRRA